MIDFPKFLLFPSIKKKKKPSTVARISLFVVQEIYKLYNSKLPHHKDFINLSKKLMPDVIAKLCLINPGSFFFSPLISQLSRTSIIVDASKYIQELKEKVGAVERDLEEVNSLPVVLFDAVANIYFFISWPSIALWT